MSTRLLSHAFGIRGYEYIRPDYQGGPVIFTIHQEPETWRCPACGGRDVRPRGQVVRRFRSLPIGSRVTVVVLPIPRLECPACGVGRQVEVPFAEARRSDTRAFERHALELSRRMTIRDVARHLGVGGDAIQEIQRRDLSRRYSQPQLRPLRRIAIAEIAVAEGHRSLTVVLDLDSGAVAFVGDGKGADALRPFGKRLRPSKARIEAVALDMSVADRSAVSAHLPGATIVFDRFHVVKLFHDKLTDLRRAWHREATDVRPKAALKGTRWPLLKDPEDLDAEEDEERRREEALAQNKPRAVASYLKEDLRQSREQPGERFATAFLNDGIKRAESSGVEMLQRMARTLAAYRSGLLSYDDVRITSGPMEGTNPKIKTMTRQAYGSRDREFFKRKILAIHETRYELVG